MTKIYAHARPSKARLMASAGLASLVAAFGAALGAAAQDDQDDTAPITTPTAVETASADADRIVVTGSRVRRDSFTSTSPLQVIDAQAIQDSGLVDIGDVLQTSSVVQGIQVDQQVTAAFTSDNGPGGQTVALRGLSSERTLVLVNGRRYAPAGVEGAPSSPDISLIPSSLVERIDLLLDGASSVYGSDAVAGVVNVILRDSYDGVRGEAFKSFPMKPGGAQTSYNFIAGTSTDRARFMFAAEYLYEESLRTDKRDWMRSDSDGLYCSRDFDYDADGNIIEECDVFQVGVGILEPSFILYYGVPGVTAAESDVSFGLGDGVPNFVNARGPLADPIYSSNSWEDYSTVAEQSYDLTPTQERTTAYTKFEYDLNALGGATLFGEASFTNRQTTLDSGHSQLTIFSPADNPFNPFGVNAAPGTPFAPGGAIGPQDASSLLLTPWRTSLDVELDQWRLIGGLKGDLAAFGLADWDYETFVGYTRSQGWAKRVGTLEDNLVLSQESVVFDPVTQTYTCGLDSSGGFFGVALQPCVPINAFAPSLYSIAPEFAEGQAAVDYLRGVRTVTTFIDEKILGGFATGPVFALPAGDVQAVAGFEWRENSIDTQSDEVALSAKLDGFFFDRPSVGSVNLWELYGELVVPIVRDAAFADEIELELAGRFVNHEFYGENSVYAGKLRYAPTDWLTFRATYGTSFRAPNLRELFLRGYSSFESADDPCEVPATAIAYDPVSGDPFYDPSGDSRTPQLLANCAADLAPYGETPTTLGLRGGSTGIQVVSAGNTGLEPERSTASSIGFVVEQPFTDAFDLRFGVSAYDIEVEDTVYEPSGQQVLSLCYNSDNYPNDIFCTRRQRNPGTGAMEEVDVTPFNISARNSTGYDFNIAFATDFMLFGRDASWRSDLVATKTSEVSELITIPGQPDDFSDFTGDIGYPEWRGTLNNTLRVGDVDLFWQARFIGAQEDPTNPGASIGGVSAVADTDNYWLHTMSAGYALDTWELRLGVQNVFDEDPPLVDDSTSGAISDRNAPLGVGYDLYGRRVFVTVAKSF